MVGRFFAHGLVTYFRISSFIMSQFTQILQVFWDICLLRKGPQDIPFSLELLSVVVLLNVGISWMQLAIGETLSRSFLQTVILMGVAFSFTLAVLYLKGVANRFVQTYTAFLATSLIVTMLIWPLVYFLVQIMLISQEGGLIRSSLNLMALFLVVFSNIWGLMIASNVFRLALDLPFVAGVLASLSLLGLNILTYSLIS